MVEALTAWRGLLLKYVTGGCIVFIQASLPLVVQSNIARRNIGRQKQKQITLAVFIPLKN